MDYEKLATQIIDNIGGKENINQLTHCVTRLRFVLKDESKAKTKEIKDLNGVITVVKSGGQYQVVIGNTVTQVYEAVLKVAGISSDANIGTNDDESRNQGLLAKFIDIVSSIFTPILPAMMAGGMIKGFNAMFAAFGWISKTSGTYLLLQAAGDAVFYFLPVFLGYTAAKKFGLKPFLGMLLGAAMVYPDILTAMSGKPIMTLFAGSFIQSAIFVKFLGVPVILMKYSSSVIPVIVATYMAAKIEKLMSKIIPSMLATALVPFFTILIAVPLTFMLVGPVITWAGDLVGQVILAIYNISPSITGLLLGAFWPLMIMFGLHWGVVPITMNNVGTLGYDPLWANAIYTPLATAGVVLAIVLKTKNSKVRSLALPAFISAIFGITEPAIYGITLPRKKTFIAGMIAGGCAGLISGTFRVKMYIMGATGIFSIPSFISPKGIDVSFYAYLAAMVTAFVVGFILTILFMYNPTIDGTGDSMGVKDNEKKVTVIENNMFDIDIPLKGKLETLKDMPDEVFSQELLGKGLAVIPSEGKIYAPFTGVIDVMFPSKHAVGLEANNGVKVLIHVGMDTVALNGKYFTSHVKQGQSVKKGQLLLEFDIDAIKAAGYALDTPVIVTETEKYLDVVADFEKRQLHVIL